MAWEARLGLKHNLSIMAMESALWLNGLGSPSGIETYHVLVNGAEKVVAKWPGKPVWD